MNPQAQEQMMECSGLRMQRRIGLTCDRHDRGWLRIQASALALGMLLTSGLPVAKAQTTSYQTLERKVPRAAIANPKSRMDVRALPAANQDAISNDVQRMGPSPGVPRVPNVVGLDYIRAEFALAPEFKAKETFEEADPSVPYGHVRATVPAAGMVATDGVVELKIPRIPIRSGIGVLGLSDIERRTGFDLDKGQYEEVYRGADIVLRAYKDEPKTDEGNTYYAGGGVYLEPSDGAVLAYVENGFDYNDYNEHGGYSAYVTCETALKMSRYARVEISKPNEGLATICVKTSQYQMAMVQFIESDNPCCHVTDYQFHYAIFPPEPLLRPRLPTELKRIRK